VNDQVAFGVRQRKPTTIEAAVSATLVCKSYLVRPTQSDFVVAPVQEESKQKGVLMEMMTRLMARMDRLEESYIQGKTLWRGHPQIRGSQE